MSSDHQNGSPEPEYLNLADLSPELQTNALQTLACQLSTYSLGVSYSDTLPSTLRPPFLEQDGMTFWMLRLSAGRKKPPSIYPPEPMKPKPTPRIV